MYLQDLEILKEIPGYKALLKAVIKSQMQMLVEQLSEQTGEETVILTASTSDGTLCHLGSGSGKDFLDGRDEIKSQFLSHCLRKMDQNQNIDVERTTKRARYADPKPSRQAPRDVALHEHNDPLSYAPLYSGQSQEPDSAEVWQSSASATNYETNIDRPVRLVPRKKRFKATPGSHIERLSEPIREGVKTSKEPGVNIKTEDNKTGEETNDLNTNFGAGNNKLASELDSSQQVPVESEKNITENVIIKEEVSHDSDGDMEILGIEPGTSSESYQGHDSSGIESYNQSFEQDGSFLGPATSSSGDLSYPQSALLDPVQLAVTDTRERLASLKNRNTLLHSKELSTNMTKNGEPESQNDNFLEKPGRYQLKRYPCLVCGKSFYQKSDVKRHEVVHTGQKFSCSICNKQFSQKHSRNLHEKAHRIGLN